ncbi:hypothetical protein SCALM49S_08936 [Streptomyces californicus]
MIARTSGTGWPRSRSSGAQTRAATDRQHRVDLGARPERLARRAAPQSGRVHHVRRVGEAVDLDDGRRGPAGRRIAPGRLAPRRPRPPPPRGRRWWARRCRRCRTARTREEVQAHGDPDPPASSPEATSTAQAAACGRCWASGGRRRGAHRVRGGGACAAACPRPRPGTPRPAPPGRAAGRPGAGHRGRVSLGRQRGGDRAQVRDVLGVPGRPAKGVVAVRQARQEPAARDEVQGVQRGGAPAAGGGGRWPGAGPVRAGAARPRRSAAPRATRPRAPRRGRPPGPPGSP